MIERGIVVYNRETRIMALFGSFTVVCDILGWNYSTYSKRFVGGRIEDGVWIVEKLVKNECKKVGYFDQKW